MLPLNFWENKRKVKSLKINLRKSYLARWSNKHYQLDRFSHINSFGYFGFVLCRIASARRSSRSFDRVASDANVVCLTFSLFVLRSKEKQKCEFGNRAVGAWGSGSEIGESGQNGDFNTFVLIFLKSIVFFNFFLGTQKTNVKLDFKTSETSDIKRSDVLHCKMNQKFRSYRLLWANLVSPRKTHFHKAKSQRFSNH